MVRGTMKKEKHSAMRYFRWTAILLCLIGITACRQDTPRFRIGVAQCSDDSWRHKMNDEILREAMFYDGVSVEIRSAGDDNRRQAEDIHYFTAPTNLPFWMIGAPLIPWTIPPVRAIRSESVTFSSIPRFTLS